MHRLRRVPRLLPGAGRSGAIRDGVTEKSQRLFAIAARWALAFSALLLVATTAAVAFYMLIPIDFDGPGILGLLAFAFPLHLLSITVVAAASAALARRCAALLAVTAFGFAAAMTAATASSPGIFLWLRSREVGVSLSLADYIGNATSVNLGGPNPAKSVAYTTQPNGMDLKLDAWKADGETLHPAMVRVHGGGWASGQRGMFGAWNPWLNQFGYTVFDIDYRLDPPEPWRDQVGDVKCALGWIAAHAAEYRVDPAQINIMGYSAGAQLAMLAAYSVGDPLLPPSCSADAVPIKAVVNLYGPTDLLRGYNSGGSLPYSQAALRRYIGGTPAEYPERYRIASPVSHINTATPPTITAMGESDRIIAVEQARVLDTALSAANVAHETYLLPATDHGFDLNWGGFATQIARAKIGQFLDRYH
jgi:acetyl esterase/lipase